MSRVPLDGDPDLCSYDVILVSLSGKDALAALDVVTREARRLGVLDRLMTVHADLGLMEWPSVTHRGRYWPSNRELVAQQSAAYGIPPARHLVAWRTVDEPSGLARPQTLLEYFAQRRRFPDAARRFCTSDLKVTKIQAALTPVVRALRRELGRPVRVLDVLGMRAEESNARAELPAYSTRVANNARRVDHWLAVHRMPTEEVRALNDASPVPHHWAYDSEPGAADWTGMSRLSCSLCILSNMHDLILAIRRRPRLAELYGLVEARLGHDFRHKAPIRSLIARAAEPGGPHPGVVLDERTPEFDQLEATVLAELDRDVPLRGGTGFTDQAACAGVCGTCG